jgi:sulfur carrier protein ThiS
MRTAPIDQTTAAVNHGAAITVRLPEPLREGRGEVVAMRATSLDDILARLDLRVDRDELFNFAVNGELVLQGEKSVALKGGDEVEIVIAFAGG